MTAQSAGYHGAHNADIVPSSLESLAVAAAASPAPTVLSISTYTVLNVLLLVTWTQQNRHTSASRAETKEGHQTSATADKMQGTTLFRLVTERFSSAGLALTQRDAYLRKTPRIDNSTKIENP
jgi:hypothetical protein